MQWSSLLNTVDLMEYLCLGYTIRALASARGSEPAKKDLKQDHIHI